MVVQVTFSDSEAATIRNAAVKANVTLEDYVRAATLLYVLMANDTYLRKLLDDSD